MQNSNTCMICLNDVANTDFLVEHDGGQCKANYHDKCFFRLTKTLKNFGCPICFKDIEADKLREIETELTKKMMGVDMTLKGGAAFSAKKVPATVSQPVGAMG
jgi:transcription initiation factor IIE alpha subunit